MVAMLLGVCHEFLGNHVEYGESVLDDGVQLLGKPLGDILRDLIVVLRVTIELLGPVPADGLELFLRPLDGGWERAVRHWPDALHQVRNTIRILNDNLFCPLLTQIGELVEHFLRRVQVERRLVVRVGEALARHDDGAVLGTLGVNEVDVTGGDRHFSGGVGQREDAAVDVLQFLLAAEARRHHGRLLRPLDFDLIGAEQEAVVSLGLDFHVVVEVHDLLDALVALPVQNGAVQLTGGAGGAHEKALPVGGEVGLQSNWFLIKVLCMGAGDKPVQVLETHVVHDQNDLMIGKRFLVPEALLDVLPLLWGALPDIIVDIGLYAVNDFDSSLARCLERSRVALQHAVIRNGHSPVPPCGRPGDELSGVGHGVHHGHVAMHVEFHALHSVVVIHARNLVHGGDGPVASYINDIFMPVAVVLYGAPDHDGNAIFELSTKV